MNPTSSTSRVLAVCLAVLSAAGALNAQEPRVRARALGVAPGIFTPGKQNAITDVAGVLVGQSTVIAGDSVHTGVTAILPHSGNMFFDRVPAAVFVGNAFGKLVGATQLKELGELETPILLTCTLCVWRAADALTAELLSMPGMENVRSINPVVGETNDGTLNAIRSRPISPADVHHALASANSGPVAEGSVGAGAGTIVFQWKGGIGTSSRVLPAPLGGWTVGVLVQTNFGGVLQVMGAPVGRELGKYAYKNDVEHQRGDGSVMIVVATDAPLSDRNLERLAARAMMGIARTGSSASNGSGDYVIAFSTAEGVRRRISMSSGSLQDRKPVLRSTQDVSNDDMSPLFEAVIESTEEAVYNSLFMATSVTSEGRTVDAIPLDRVREILAKYNVGKR
ncbi:MAG TPA: P1 family peptidase [Gemmatimonadaceae bacterium]|nr:P1 family peptidase [Gemmatimonadaceae bacterium]